MKNIVLAVALATLTACAVSQKDGVMEAETRSGGLFGLSEYDEVEVSTGEAFAGKKQVIIGGFKVGFNESKSLSKQASGGLLGGGFGGRSTGKVKLEGVSDSVRQAIADAAYTSFVAKLKEHGYTVLDRSKFTGSDSYEGAKKYQFPYEADDSGFLSSYGVANYYSPKAFGNEQLVFFGDIPGVTGGFAFGNGNTATSEFANETGTPVLHVSYLVDFAGAGGHAGMTTSSVEVGQLLSVDQGNMGIIGGHGGTFSSNIGSVQLGQPVASKKEFATIENTSSDVGVGVETAINIASALVGGGTNHSREFVFHADAAKYTSASLDALNKAMDLMIKKAASY